jgi:sec-independent protein translocase protein TatA
MIGIPEVLLIGAVLVIIFGASQIPKIARSVGEGLKEFKKAVKDVKEDDENNESDDKISKKEQKTKSGKKE